MKRLITLSVIASPLFALFRSSSYSYSSGSPYYSSSNYYYSSNYYTTSYRSQSRYSNDDYKSYTYMGGSSKATVSAANILQGVQSVSYNGVVNTYNSFKAGKLQYYFGSQYMPSQSCGGTTSATVSYGKRKKRAAAVASSTTTTTTKIPSSTQKGASSSAKPTSSPPPVNWTGTPPNGTYSGNETFWWGNGSVWNSTYGDNGNFSDLQHLLAYMNMFYVNFSDPAESLNYLETYLPANFSVSNSGNISSIIQNAVSYLPFNTSRYVDFASTMMGGSNINSSISAWYNDMQDESSYNDMLSSTSGSGPIQTNVGCSQNSAYAVCTRSVSDLDYSIYSYVFTPAFPSEIAWQCPNKDQYCCEWECCQERKMSVAGTLFFVIFTLLAVCGCCLMCALCSKGKQTHEKETLVVMYPKPQPQAYFISVPPRVYY